MQDLKIEGEYEFNSSFKHLEYISGVYAILNKTQNIFYIGYTQNLRQRLSSHRSKLKNNSHRVFNMQKDFRVGNNFSFVVLETFDRWHGAMYREKEIIKEYEDNGIKLYNEDYTNSGKVSVKYFLKKENVKKIKEIALIRDMSVNNLIDEIIEDMFVN